MRSYEFGPTPTRPAPLRVELHMLGCECPACEPDRPYLPPRLTSWQIARQALAALVLAHALPVAIWGPRAVAHILWCDVTGARP